MTDADPRSTSTDVIGEINESIKNFDLNLSSMRAERRERERGQTRKFEAETQLLDLQHRQTIAREAELQADLGSQSVQPERESEYQMPNPQTAVEEDKTGFYIKLVRDHRLKEGASEKDLHGPDDYEYLIEWQKHSRSTWETMDSLKHISDISIVESYYSRFAVASPTMHRRTDFPPRVEEESDLDPRLWAPINRGEETTKLEHERRAEETQLKDSEEALSKNYRYSSEEGEESDSDRESFARAKQLQELRKSRSKRRNAEVQSEHMEKMASINQYSSEEEPTGRDRVVLSRADEDLAKPREVSPVSGKSREHSHMPRAENTGQPPQGKGDAPPLKKDEVKPVKSILRQPRPYFPEDPSPIREGVASPRHAAKDGIPADARWTKITRKLVNPAALEAGKERFETRDEFVIVLRVLSKEEVHAYAELTQQIRSAYPLGSTSEGE